MQLFYPVTWFFIMVLIPGVHLLLAPVGLSWLFLRWQFAVGGFEFPETHAELVDDKIIADAQSEWDEEEAAAAAAEQNADLPELELIDGDVPLQRPGQPAPTGPRRARPEAPHHAETWADRVLPHASFMYIVLLITWSAALFYFTLRSFYRRFFCPSTESARWKEKKEKAFGFFAFGFAMLSAGGILAYRGYNILKGLSDALSLFERIYSQFTNGNQKTRSAQKWRSHLKRLFESDRFADFSADAQTAVIRVLVNAVDHNADALTPAIVLALKALPTRKNANYEADQLDAWNGDRESFEAEAIVAYLGDHPYVKIETSWRTVWDLTVGFCNEHKVGLLVTGFIVSFLFLLALFHDEVLGFFTRVVYWLWPGKSALKMQALTNLVVSEGKKKKTSGRIHRKVALGRATVQTRSSRSSKRQWIYDLNDGAWVSVAPDVAATLIQTDRFASADDWRWHVLNHSDQYDLSETEYDMLMAPNFSIDDFVRSRVEEETDFTVDDTDYDVTDFSIYADEPEEEAAPIRTATPKKARQTKQKKEKPVKKVHTTSVAKKTPVKESGPSGIQKSSVKSPVHDPKGKEKEREPKAEAEGVAPSFTMKWATESVMQIGTGKNSVLVPIVGNGFLCTSHVREILVSDFGYNSSHFIQINDEYVSTQAGKEHLWLHKKPTDRSWKGLSIKACTPALMKSQCVLKGPDNEFSSGKLLSLSRNVLKHDSTTAVRWCNTPVMLNGTMVALHIGTEGKNQNCAFALTEHTVESIKKALKDLPGNSSGGASN
jgi:hypothetical protein